MKNNKARFRGDLQVDGAIIGRDGQPIEFGGGGSVDWAEPIPEINFAGDPTDDHAGGTLAWDDDWYGLVFKGRSGSYDSELYLVDPDDNLAYANMWPQGLMLQSTYAGEHPGLMLHTGGSVPPYIAVAKTLAYDSGDAFRVHDSTIYDGFPVFSIAYDGSLHWSGNTAAPDVILERADPEWWGASGLLHLDTTPEIRSAGGAAGIIFGSLAPGAGGSYIYEGGFGANFDQNNISAGAGDYAEISTAAAGTVRASLRADPGDSPQAHVNILNYGHNSLNISALETRSSVEFFFITDWATDHAHGMTMRARPGVDGFLETLENGGGYVAHSPDGTAYKLTPPNGGGAATWVAA